jgi:hypothetical protein
VELFPMAENTPWTLEPVQIPSGMAVIEGDLIIPSSPSGTVVFAHGSGSSRHSARNRYVARVLTEAGFATLLIDLFTVDEEVADALTSHLRFDISFLAQRLIAATDWLAGHPEIRRQPLAISARAPGPLPRYSRRPGAPTEWRQSSRAVDGRISPGRRSVQSVRRRCSSSAGMIFRCSS